MGRSTVVALLLGALVWSGTASGVAPKPTLKLLDATPVTVRGAGFHARERVRVTVVSAERHVRTVRTSLRGTFTVAFDGVTLGFDRCGNGGTITARGARGDSATLKLPQPDCPPPLGP